MMEWFTRGTTLLLLLLLSSSHYAFSQECEPGNILVAGSLPIELLANAWKTPYLQEVCEVSSSDPTTTIVVESGGSSTGAARVCGTRAFSEPVDIGGMTRTLNDQEAASGDNWNFECNRSIRSVIQLEVGVEGVAATVAVDSPGHVCIRDHLGGGLSLDQLRWIYSNYDESELKDSGWTSSSVPFTDKNPNTHKWSELSEDCADEEILIGGPPVDSNNWDLFDLTVFKGNDETFDVTREGAFFATNEDEAFVQLTDFLGSSNSTSSIAFFGLVAVLTELDIEKFSVVNHVTEDDEVIKPSGVTFQDGSFPLGRRLYMNFFNDEESLRKTRPLLEFGLFSRQADELAKSVGVWPITESEKLLMATRLQTASGVPLSEIEQACGPENEEILIAGSSTVFPVANIWAQVYKVGCPSISVSVEGGGSSAGAGRVCANDEKGTPVMIGDMSREWKVPAEATNDSKEFLYECKKGDLSRSAIQVDVAIDGLTVAMKEGGLAWECITLLGGLTVDQLRWIYSSYDDIKLVETGWDPSSLLNTDNDSSTHRWNELDSRCANQEIRIAGADDASGTYEYFLETVLSDHDNGETFDSFRPLGYENSEDDDILVEYLENFGGAISYFGYAYYFENRDLLSAVAIENANGDFVLPEASSIGDGSYSPLARRIYMNLLNNEEALSHTAPFVTFGLNNPALVEVTGYVPVPVSDINELISERIEPAPHALEESVNGSSNTGAIVGGSIAGVLVLGLVAFFACGRGTCSSKEEEKTDGGHHDTHVEQPFGKSSY